MFHADLSRRWRGFLLLSSLVGAGALAGWFLPRGPVQTALPDLADERTDKSAVPYASTDAGMANSRIGNELTIFQRFRLREDSDYPTLQSDLAALPEEDRVHALAGFLTRVAELDPLELPKAIAQLEPPAFVIQAAFETLASGDPTLAARLWPDLHPLNRTAAARGIATALSALGEHAAEKVLVTLDHDSPNLSRTLAYFLSLQLAARGDPDLLQGDIVKRINQNHLKMAQNVLLGTIAAANPMEAVGLIRDKTFSLLTIEEDLMPYLFNASPSIILEAANSAERPGKALIALLRATCCLDADFVADLLSSVEVETVQQEVSAWYLAKGRASNQELRGFLDTICSTDAEKYRLIGDAIAQARKSGALEHAWKLADLSENPQKFRSEIIVSFAKEDPFVATGFIDQLGLYHDEALVASVVKPWSRTDPAGASRWLAMNRDALGEKAQAYSNLASAWVRSDSFVASQWIGQSPPGANRDAAISELVEVMAPLDLEAARAWAGAITDPAVRGRKLASLESYAAQPTP